MFGKISMVMSTTFSEGEGIHNLGAYLHFIAVKKDLSYLRPNSLAHAVLAFALDRCRVGFSVRITSGHLEGRLVTKVCSCGFIEAAGGG